MLNSAGADSTPLAVDRECSQEFLFAAWLLSLHPLPPFPIYFFLNCWVGTLKNLSKFLFSPHIGTFFLFALSPFSPFLEEMLQFGEHALEQEHN